MDPRLTQRVVQEQNFDQRRHAFRRRLAQPASDAHRGQQSRGKGRGHWRSLSPQSAR